MLLPPLPLFFLLMKFVQPLTRYVKKRVRFSLPPLTVIQGRIHRTEAIIFRILHDTCKCGAGPDAVNLVLMLHRVGVLPTFKDMQLVLKLFDSFSLSDYGE